MRDVRRTRIPPQPALKGRIQIEHADFRKWDLPPASVDLIFTDPLYGKEFLPLYSDLANFAATVLKPGSILMVYAPQLYMNDVIRRLDEHLLFHWPCALLNDECSQPNFQRGFFSGFRPVLVYTKGESRWFGKGRVEKPEHYVRDTFKRGPKEKSLYVYQQPVDEAIYFISKLTRPGELIVDCFGGSLTTAEAVYRLGGRSFLGCDIDEGCVNMGRERLAQLMCNKGELTEVRLARSQEVGMTNDNQQSRSVRECGKCTACCTVMAVAELKKRNYEKCCHLADRCSIYASRPPSCRDWSCNWLLGEIEGDERRRPDNLGLLFTWESRGDGCILAAYEVWDGAANDPKARYVLNKLQKQWAICLVYTSNRFEILSSDKGQREELTKAVASSVQFADW